MSNLIKCERCNGVMDPIANEIYTISSMASAEGTGVKMMVDTIDLCQRCYSAVMDMASPIVPDNGLYLKVKTHDEIYEHYEGHEVERDEDE